MSLGGWDPENDNPAMNRNNSGNENGDQQMEVESFESVNAMSPAGWNPEGEYMQMTSESFAKD